MMAMSDWLRINPTCLEPAHPGHVHVEQHQIETVLSQFFERLLPVLRIVDFIALAGQRDPHHAANLRIVVDHEDPAGAHLAAPSFGSDNVN